MDKAEIIKANQNLLNRRRALGLHGERQNSKPQEQPEQSEIMAYFEALRTGQPTGNQSHVVSGDRAKWDAFNAYHPALVTARRIVARWYADQPGPGAVILAGNPGSGKTHLAKAVAQMAGPLAVFANEIDLLKAIQATYSDHGASEAGLLLKYQRAKILIYDDLGTYKTQNLDWVQGIYYSLFNGRKEAGAGTLITTNLAMERWGTNGEGEPVFLNSPLEDRMGKRVFSRVMGQVDKMENYVDLFGVPDYRTKGME